jgi:hypothetical protein
MGEQHPISDAVALKAARKQNREYKHYLSLLTKQVTAFLAQLDVEMSQPSTPERGRRIAQLTGALELANDQAKRYGLGLDFNGKKLK